MITVISGTNRSESGTTPIARQLAERLGELQDIPVKFFSLEQLDGGFLHAGMYEAAGQHPSITALQDEYILPAQKFLFVSPEYNGSYPGILKLFIDALSIRAYKATFEGKKAALVGVASGRAGNLRGMDHLSGTLMHMGTQVMPGSLPISSIKGITNPGGTVTDAATLKAMDQFLTKFIAF